MEIPPVIMAMAIVLVVSVVVAPILMFDVICEEIAAFRKNHGWERKERIWQRPKLEAGWLTQLVAAHRYPASHAAPLW